jgi:hypothetical protein
MSPERGPWIKTIPRDEADERLIEAVQKQSSLYPQEYATPVASLMSPEPGVQAAGIVMSHSLLPDTLYHAFATYGTLLSPDLPLSRQQHEMIASTVSALNRCHY